jgi:hypothetical protein
MENTGNLRPLDATKAQSGGGDIPPPYLKWALEVGGGQLHTRAPLLPRSDPVPFGGGWVRARAGLEGYKKKKKIAPTGNRTPHRPGCRK